MIPSRKTPIPERDPDDELDAGRASDPTLPDPQFHQLPIDQDLERRTIASPPPDFALDDEPTLEHYMDDFGLDDPTLKRPLTDFDADLPDDDPHGDRPTLVEDEPDSDERHDTDPAPPPSGHDAE